MSYFGEPNARIQKMKDELLDITPQVCVERAIYTTEAYKEHKDKQNILTVSYTHLDVYKRQHIKRGWRLLGSPGTLFCWMSICRMAVDMGFAGV